VAFFVGSALGRAVPRGAVAIGFVAAAAPILPIGLLALGSAAIARGLAALRVAGCGFRAISGTARRRISRDCAGCENQAANSSQKQNLLHHEMSSYFSCRMPGTIRPLQGDTNGHSGAPFSVD
jgi:hypothetical protein